MATRRKEIHHDRRGTYQRAHGRRGTCPPPPRVFSDRERQRILSQYIAGEVTTRKARVETQVPDQAVLVYGKPVSHVLHVILSIFTAGLWLIPWLIMSFTGGEKRKIVRVDEFGNLLVT